jgi:Protein of unknown function (DUF4038)/Domain of unknown function (DUF5060)
MTMHVQRNCMIEFAFQSTTRVADPYNDVEVDVCFTGPDGTPFRVPAFWAGDNVWKVRFAGSAVGSYAFVTEASDPDDRGLHGQSGTIDVHPYTGPNPLLEHGRLRASADGRYFEHADGTPFLWVGDTWWMGLTTRLDWPQGFKELTADRVDKGFSVIQIIAGPYPDMDAWDPRGRNQAGFPFEADFARINPAYYDHADLKIGHLVQSGLMPCIVGMWGYYLKQLGVEKAKRFWRHLVARYGAYPVTWCICGEATMPYYLSETREDDAALQKKGWTEVMAYVRDIDGYRNLISVHTGHYGRNEVEDDSLMDFEMLQTGHGDIESVPNTRDSVIAAVAREPRMPVVCSEVNYEGIQGRCWQNIQRLCFYSTMLNGAAGHTYGANGIWQLNSPDEPYGPSPHGRSWGNMPWQEAAQLPGSRQVGLGGRFLRRFNWWELQPQPHWTNEPDRVTAPYRCISRGLPHALRIIYAPHCWDAPTIEAVEPGVTYRAYYWDPCIGAETDLGEVTPDAEGRWTPTFPPECHDWLIVMEAVAG